MWENIVSRIPYNGPIYGNKVVILVKRKYLEL
jgi:hypothetical protein